MVMVSPDAQLMQLAHLDVIDVRSDGSLVLNGRFLTECQDAYAADSSLLGTVIGSYILARALAIGVVVDVEGLTLAALDVGCAPPRMS
jgi:hypothetical protein